MAAAIASPIWRCRPGPCRGVDIGCAQAIGNDTPDGCLDCGGRLFLGAGKAQHHGGGEDLRDRIGNAFASDIRGGAAARFIHSETRRAGSFLAEAGARKHSQRAGEHGNFIAQNVAEKILRQHDIEPLWILHQLHGSVVHVEVAETDVWEVSCSFLDDAPPEDAVLQDIGLVDRGDLFRRLRRFESDLGNAANLAFSINHRIHRDLLPALLLDEFRLPK